MRWLVAALAGSALVASPALAQDPAPVPQPNPTGTMGGTATPKPDAAPVVITPNAIIEAEPLREQVAPNQPRAGEPPGTGALPGAAPVVGTGLLDLSARQLKDRDVYNLRGDELAEVETVLIGPENRVFLVLTYGGFLGVGERKVMLPLDRFVMRDDRLVLVNMTDDELRALPVFNREAALGYREAETDYRTNITLGR